MKGLVCLNHCTFTSIFVVPVDVLMPYTASVFLYVIRCLRFALASTSVCTPWVSEVYLQAIGLGVTPLTPHVSHVSFPRSVIPVLGPITSVMGLMTIVPGPYILVLGPSRQSWDLPTVVL